jgi:hypothetical protein
MKLTEEQRLFIRNHATSEVTTLLLNAAKIPTLNIPFLVEQILARRQIKDKLPMWFDNDQLVFPSKIAAEQCSSESTARYKQALITSEDIVCDLTGGLGIDSYYFSTKAHHLYYMERFPSYCEAARLNFAALDAQNVTVIEADSTQCLEALPNASVFYIDPARRAEGNKRVFALADCEPDLCGIKATLLKQAPCLIAKISPMADIQLTLQLLPETTEVHVLSVKNECKELLFVLRSAAITQPVEPKVHCVNFTTAGDAQHYTFTISTEQATQLPYTAQKVGAYLYEPNASILKAGAFKQVAQAFGVNKLQVNSHLYSSEVLCKDFPGRIFEVEEVIPFSTKVCKSIHKSIPQANITARNFPLSVDMLRKKTKIADGGAVYLFATTRYPDEKVLIQCKKVN